MYSHWIRISLSRRSSSICMHICYKTNSWARGKLCASNSNRWCSDMFMYHCCRNCYVFFQSQCSTVKIHYITGKLARVQLCNIIWCPHGMLYNNTTDYITEKSIQNQVCNVQMLVSRISRKSPWINFWFKKVKLERNADNSGREFWAWIFWVAWNPGKTRPKNSLSKFAIKIRWEIRRQFS